jgi:CspA family cold shock protein
MLKNIITSILIGALAYLTIHFIQSKDLIPASLPAVLELAIIIIAIFAGSIIARPSSPAEPTETAELEEGAVKWFNVKKGYGFITRDQGDDVFVHFRNIEGEGRRSISEGDRVSFVVINGDKGLQADQVNTI